MKNNNERRLLYVNIVIIICHTILAEIYSNYIHNTRYKKIHYLLTLVCVFCANIIIITGKLKDINDSRGLCGIEMMPSFPII